MAAALRRCSKMQVGASSVMRYPMWEEWQNHPTTDESILCFKHGHQVKALKCVIDKTESNNG